MSFVVPVNEKNFEEEVLKSDKMVLIDFYADWCGPCKSLVPTLEKFAEENKDTVKVVKINVDESPNLAGAFQVRSIPTLVTIKGNQPLFYTTGALPKQKLEEFVGFSLQELQKNNMNGQDNSAKPPKNGGQPPKGPGA